MQSDIHLKVGMTVELAASSNSTASYIPFDPFSQCFRQTLVITRLLKAEEIPSLL